MNVELSASEFTNLLSPSQQEELACILDRYLVSLEQGDTPNLSEICARHEELAPAIRHYVKSLMFLNHAAGKADSRKNCFKQIDAPNKEIGDFRIIREVGRGGMGVVYEATQISLGRRVALKLLPFAAVLDQRQIARFQNEAQAAAQLHHPHIVPVYSIGNDRGTYYYSMQFVDGQSLERVIEGLQIGYDSWSMDSNDRDASDWGSEISCDRNGTTLDGDALPFEANELEGKVSGGDSIAKKSTRALSTHASIRARSHIRRMAELGIQAADAIQYAHEHGIVHRDIKPSNLLIDRGGKLWVADFGLAQCGGFGSLTRSGDVIGTLRYMSPEQAAGKTHWIDNRTDIYSLGLTLYELLTLSPVVKGQDRLMMLRQIESEQPTPPRRLNPSIPVDLENVILKAISKEREDRYATAGELAQDLQRWLDGNPTLARRPSIIDRAGRWVAKNAKLVTVGFAMLLLVSSISALTASIFRAKNRAIEQANLLATKHLSVANNVFDRFGAQLMAKLEWLPGTEELQQEVAQNSIDYLNAFADYASHDPNQQTAVCRAFLKLAKLQELQGADNDAIRTYRRAMDSLPLSGSQISDEKGISDEFFYCHNNLACALMRVGSLDQAIDLFEQCLRLVDRSPSVDGSQSQSRAYRQALLHLNLGHLYRERGERRSAAAEFETAWNALGNVSDAPANSTELYPMLVTALLQVASDEVSDRALVIRMLNLALDLAQANAKSNADLITAQHEVCVCQLALGARFAKEQSYGPAKVWFEKAVAGLQRLSLRCPSNVRLQSDHASALNNLGQSELSSGNTNGALTAFHSAQKILAALASNTSDYSIRSNLGGVLNNLAIAEESMGEIDIAKNHLIEAIDHQKLALLAAPECERCQEFLTEHESHLLRVSGQSPSLSKEKTNSNHR